MDDNLKDVARVGLASGAFGFLLGGTAGILKSTTPVLFGAASAIQCSVLGSSFWFSRGLVLRAWNDEAPVKASAIAGGVSGGLSAIVFRGPRNVLPGIICIAAFGAAGQAFYDRASRKSASPTVWQRMTTAKWSPLQSISDEQYMEMLHEQLLKNQVEVAILDDKIAALKQEVDETLPKRRPG